jgi:hypothetical protein
LRIEVYWSLFLLRLHKFSRPEYRRERFLRWWWPIIRTWCRWHWIWWHIWRTMMHGNALRYYLRSAADQYLVMVDKLKRILASQQQIYKKKSTRVARETRLNRSSLF